MGGLYQLHNGNIGDSIIYRTFLIIMHYFNLPGSLFFFYLQSRSKLKAHGKTFYPLTLSRTCLQFRRLRVRVWFLRSISFWLSQTTSHYQWSGSGSKLPRTRPGIWLAWGQSDISLVLRNQDQQQIHYNFIDRTYLTPIRLHNMRIANDRLCALCPMGAQGTYINMMWDYQFILEQCCIQAIYLNSCYCACNCEYIDSDWPVYP